MGMFPTRCVSYNEKGRPCRHKVSAPGKRCPSCWNALVRSPNIAVRTLLAKEPDMPQEVLNLLASDHIMTIRMAVAELPNLPYAIQEQLARDDVPIRRVLITNPRVDPVIWQKLAETNDRYIQQVVADHTGANNG